MANRERWGEHPSASCKAVCFRECQRLAYMVDDNPRWFDNYGPKMPQVFVTSGTSQNPSVASAGTSRSCYIFQLHILLYPLFYPQLYILLLVITDISQILQQGYIMVYPYINPSVISTRSYIFWSHFPSFWKELRQAPQPSYDVFQLLGGPSVSKPAHFQGFSM